jgi:hypothetical protein
MLQGTLDVFSLDEVLGLLSSARKSGVLNITGDRGVGTVSIADGLLVAGSASSAPGVDGIAEAVFELLRFEEGSFSFDGDAATEGEATELEEVLAEAHARLGEWRGIEAVVPSLDHHLALAESLATSQVTLNESEWAAIVAIGEGATVGVVAHRLDLGEFDGSKQVKGLVERSLATISDAAPVVPVDLPVPAALVSDPVEDAPAPEESAVESPAFEEPHFDTPAPPPATLDMPVPDPIAEAPSFDADAVDGDAGSIPPMPDAPELDTNEVDETAADIPPMPEPPRHIDDEAAIAGEFAAPIEAETLEPMTPTVDDPASSFGGLDPIGPVDMFEPPQRNTDGDDEGFLIADDASPASDADADSIETADTTEIPSLAPPAFDPDAFAVNKTDDDGSADVSADPFASDASDGAVEAQDSAEAGEDDNEPEKGGSLLMRYLKSHG